MISYLWDQLDPGFLMPIWLAVGALAVLAVALLEAGGLRWRAESLRQFLAPHLVRTLTANVSLPRRLLKAALLIAAVGLLFIALARPHLFFGWRDEARTGLDVLVAVDCSKSMLTQDVRPNRIERAKLALADFTERLPDNRLGLIAFAGDAFLQCPLTLDHEAFAEAVRELDTDTIPRPGTDIAAAIDQAVDALKSQPANTKFLILVTDGEDLEGRSVDAARKASEQDGLKIFTVGVGTPEGGTIPERDETGAVSAHQDSNGQVVESHLDESTLRQIAEVSGGSYVALGQQGEGLTQIYNQAIASLPRQNFEEKRERVPVERFEWFLAPAIVLLMLEFLLRERASDVLPATGVSSAMPSALRRRRRAAAAALRVLALGLVLPHAAAASASDSAERDYKAGKYEEAMDLYRKAAETDPTISDLEYNRGDAAYKAGNYSEAELAFRKALETPDLALQERTYYNLGNTQYQHGEEMRKVDSKKTIKIWKQALRSYDSALKLRDAADTRHNYEYVKRKLDELKQQMQGQPQQGGGQPSDDDDNSNPNQQQGQGGDNPKDGIPKGGSDDGKDAAPYEATGDTSDQKKPGDSKQTESNPSGSKEKLRTYSGTRPEDEQDPGIKSRQDAENLLDSLKDDEHHVSARSFQNGNPPPTPSGKDW
jgi:Ca-activated chloride channel family protein